MNGKSFAFLLASLLAIGVVLAIALSDERPGTLGTPYETFRAQRVLWESRRPTHYAVRIDRQCFCRPYSVRVRVSGANVEHLEFLYGPGDPIEISDRRYPRDVDSLFKIIDDAYASRAFRIEVVFDDTYGYPAKAFIDRSRDTVDDESTFELTDFESGHVG